MQATHALLPGTQAPLPGFEAAFIAASTMGFVVWGVTLDRDGGGLTGYLAGGDGPRVLLVTFVGYLGPSGFGLGAAKLVETGHAVGVLWIAAFFLVLLLFIIRKSFGVVSVPAAITLLAFVMRYAHAGPEKVVVYGMT